MFETLEVSLSSQYTLSVEMLLDRFGQSNKFSKKSWKNFWTSKWVLWWSFRGRPESTSKGRPLNVRSGRPKDVRSGRPRDGQIRSLGDVLGTLEGDVLGTNICRLGLMISSKSVLIKFSDYCRVELPHWLHLFCLEVTREFYLYI